MRLNEYVGDELENIKANLDYGFLEGSEREILGHFIGHDRAQNVSNNFMSAFSDWLFFNFEDYLKIESPSTPFVTIKSYLVYQPLELGLDASVADALIDEQDRGDVYYIGDYAYVNTVYDFIGIDLSDVPVSAILEHR